MPSLEESWEIKLGPLTRKAGRLNFPPTQQSTEYIYAAKRERTANNCVREGYQSKMATAICKNVTVNVSSIALELTIVTRKHKP